MTIGRTVLLGHREAAGIGATTQWSGIAASRGSKEAAVMSKSQGQLLFGSVCMRSAMMKSARELQSRTWGLSCCWQPCEKQGDVGEMG